MQGFLNGLVTFATQGDRNRAKNAIESWVTNFNATHPSAVFVGSTTTTTAVDPDTQQSERALSLAYTCTDYSGIEAAMVAIAQDVEANSFLNIINLSTGLVA